MTKVRVEYISTIPQGTDEKLDLWDAHIAYLNELWQISDNGMLHSQTLLDLSDYKLHNFKLTQFLKQVKNFK
jgi:hypothetical protein